MQPAPPDILTAEIPLPSTERVDLRDRHIHASYQPLLQSQIQANAMSQAHIEALTLTCQQLKAKEAAQAARIADLETQIRTYEDRLAVEAVADEIASKRNGKAADAVKAG